MVNILICDDQKDIVSALEIYLRAEGYQTFSALNGKEALAILEKEEISLCLLDIMMPEMDGITALTRLRESSNIPVIFLTAKSEDTDKILGLDLGADDYITKPFNPVEVLARVRSHLRRYMRFGAAKEEKKDESLYSHAGIELNDRTKTVLLDGDPISLTPTEFEILKLFLQNPGTVFSPKEIYRRVWQDSPQGAEGTVAVHIRHLREKIEIDPAEPRYIKVVWAQGYKLEAIGSHEKTNA